MPLKKSELYSSFWRSCDELRGGMNARQYKDCALVLLFVKYVSDKYAGKAVALFICCHGSRIFANELAVRIFRSPPLYQRHPVCKSEV